MKSLCEALLIVDPWSRLGSGPEGSPLSFTALKEHEFFGNKNFDNISEYNPPVSPEILSKLTQESQKSFSEFDSTIDLAVCSETDKNVLNAKSNPEEIKTLKEGIVDKKCGWIFYYNRKLILTSETRLSYYLPKTNEYRVNFQ